MRFWIREIAGWLLVGIGLLVLFSWLGALTERSPNGMPMPRLLEAAEGSVIGIFIFRGGIHLLKVAVAARVCTQAQHGAAPDRAMPSVPVPPSERAHRPLPSRPRL